MRVASILALPFALVIAVLAIGQVDTLQTTLRSLTSGATQSMAETTTLIMLFVAVIVCLGGLLGVLTLFMGRR